MDPPGDPGQLDALSAIAPARIARPARSDGRAGHHRRGQAAARRRHAGRRVQGRRTEDRHARMRDAALEPAGPLKTGTFATTEPSELELARRAKIAEGTW